MRVTSLKGNGTQRKSNYQWMQMFSLEAEDECRGSCPRGPRPPRNRVGRLWATRTQEYLWVS